MERRLLIVNADDFGLSAGINRGVIEAQERGIVTSTSLMVRGEEAAAAAEYARGRPQLDTGLHIDLGEWKFAAGEWETLYEVVPLDDIRAVETEIEAQVAAFRTLVGADPTHLDSHQHVHRRDAVRAVLSRLARSMSIPLRHESRIAYCGEFYGQTGEGMPLPSRIDAGALAKLISALPAGVTELACHPGYAEDLPTMYRNERALEVEALCNPRVRAVLDRERIELVRFTDLSPQRLVVAGAMKAQSKLGGSSLSIIVLGYIVRGPLGGLTWHHLQYVLGLAALGHTVHFFEDSDDYPSCYDPSRGVTDTDPTYGLAYIAGVFSRVGMAERWAYHDAHTSTWHGPCAGSVERICGEADLVLNVSGVNPLRPWLLDIPARALIDTDPVFTQVRHLTGASEMASARGHTVFFTFGENYGRPGCTIPQDGLPWLPTRQPVVLDLWPVSAPPAGGRFTTTMQWESYPIREYAGVRYGMKSDSFAPFASLPARVAPPLELALGGGTAPRSELEALGWIVRDPLEVTRDPRIFQDYIRGSRAEFSVAKHGYVVSNSGWFSDRSAGYLASGRPVITQQTGFSDWLTAGAGVLPFVDADEAAAAIGEVEARYALHSEAARAIAETWFDSAKVLQRLIESALSSSGNQC